MRIQHEVLNENRAGYGEQIIKELAKRLTDVYGKGFSMRSLYYFVKFYYYCPLNITILSQLSENE